MDYTNITSLSKEEFLEKASISHKNWDQEKLTISDKKDVASMENLLDLKAGTLSNQKFYLEKYQCSCHRVLTMYDFVYTGLVDGKHSKSFIAHMFLGTKFVLQKSRKVRCSNCGTVSQIELDYGCNNYGCNTQP